MTLHDHDGPPSSPPFFDGTPPPPSAPPPIEWDGQGANPYDDEIDRAAAIEGEKVAKRAEHALHAQQEGRDLDAFDLARAAPPPEARPEERAAIEGAPPPAPREWGHTDSHGAHHDGPRPTPRAPGPGERNGGARAEEQRPIGAIASAWHPIDPSWFTTPPPARRWLLRHPTRDGQRCAPGMGDGMLPLGKVGLLVADGGVGKTMTLFDLGVAIIAGRKWLGHFDIGHEARRGRVLLALAEEDEEENRRRLFAVCQAYKLTAEEQARVVDRLVVLPLAGKPVSLLGYGRDGRTLTESAELVTLREQLTATAGDDGWSLVALDPLARWGADDMEKDNAVATRTLQSAETLLEVPGRPTVLLAHHTSEVAARVNNPRARGATGIRNGARWEAVLREEGRDVYFKQTKSNYSRPMRDELRLVRGPGGLLRVPSAGEEQEHQARAAERQESKAAEKDARREARITTTMEAMVDAVRTAVEPITARAGIVGLVKGEKSTRESALVRLLATGRIKRVPPSGKGVYLVPDPHPADPTDPTE